MTRLTRRAATSLAIVLTCALPAGSAQAARTTSNTATAIVQQDDGRAFDFAWNLSTPKRIDVVDHTNTATARGNCVGCSATAIAFQVVLVTGTPTPTTVVPVNVADAQNVVCSECLTVAEARQFVRVYPEPVKLTDTGRAILADVRDTLAALEARNLPFDQLHQAIEAQESRVRSVLANELVLKANPAQEADVVLQQQLLQDAELG